MQTKDMVEREKLHVLSENGFGWLPILEQLTSEVDALRALTLSLEKEVTALKAKPVTVTVEKPLGVSEPEAAKEEKVKEAEPLKEYISAPWDPESQWVAPEAWNGRFCLFCGRPLEGQNPYFCRKGHDSSYRYLEKTHPERITGERTRKGRSMKLVDLGNGHRQYRGPEVWKNSRPVRKRKHRAVVVAGEGLRSGSLDAA